MKVDWRASTWKQFGAAIDMLGDAIRLCPDHLWTVVVYTDPDDERYGQFWFIAYHTLRWLDLYLTGTIEGFTPPSPFIHGALPERTLHKGSDPCVSGRLPREVPIDDRSTHRRESATTLRIRVDGT